MINRESIIGVGSLIGYPSLLFGVVGQGVFVGPMLKPYLSTVGTLFVVMIPWYIVFGVTFLNQPFLAPRPYRITLSFAMAWFAVLTIAAEILHFFGFIPPHASHFAGIFSRILMHTGWLCLLFVIPRCVAARRLELTEEP